MATRFAKLAWVAALLTAQSSAGGPDLMPLPASITVGAGRLRMDASFRMVLRGPGGDRVQAAARRFLDRLERAAGLRFTKDGSGTRLILDWQENAPAVPRAAEDESYALEIGSSEARLRAASSIGILRGLETLLQCLRIDVDGPAFPVLTIRDQPRFPWRGLLLDTSRHFLPAEAIERVLEGMAVVKFNVLHWHLSDDQGFRMESHVFPKLHELGSDGRFYSQAQIREVIGYAADRGIRVVPEFDMPGHASSWFVGYPELASAPGPYSIERRWGLFEPAMDPTRPALYTFLDVFFGEVATLFPDPYVHIGGDEVEPAQWSRNSTIQAFMKAQSLATTQALQGYFNRQVQPLLTSRGKTMVSWDETLRAGLPPDSVVQSWRGLSSVAEAVRSGHPAILSFGYYLDQLQPASDHYLIDPYGGEVSGVAPADRARVLGGEACLWSEYISPDNLSLRLWPRAAAIAERLWSPQQNRDVESMYVRLEAARSSLKLAGIDLETDRRRMLERMADSASVGPLEILLESLRPVRAANRGDRPVGDQQALPFNRLVDVADPDNGVRRLTVPETRAALKRGRDNYAAVLPILRRFPNLHEAIPLAERIRDLSIAALEALDDREKGRRPSPAKLALRRQFIERTAPARAGLTITTVQTLRNLIESR